MLEEVDGEDMEMKVVFRIEDAKASLITSYPHLVKIGVFSIEFETHKIVEFQNILPWLSYVLNLKF